MVERIVNQSWWVASLLLIFITASLAMLIFYRACFKVIDGAYATALLQLLAGLTLAAAAMLLSKHRTDLV